MKHNLLKRQGINVEKLFAVIKAKAETSQGEAPNDDSTQATGNETDNTTGNQENSTVNFEELISKARKEEKDKLYPQIQGYKKQVDDLTSLHNNTLLDMASKDKTIEELNKRIEELSQTKATPEDVAQLTSQIQALQLENQQLKESQVNVEELTTKINSEWEVKLYREQKLREVGNTVIPELVNGATKEEIDQSLELSQQRFREIVQQNHGGIGSLPSSNINTNKYTIKDINPLDVRNMSMEEWAEKRKAMGLK